MSPAGLLTIAKSSERMRWGQNIFGSVAPWICLCCGPVWSRPITITIERPTRQEPGEYQWQCPYCAGWDIEENENGVQPMVVRRRYSIHRNPKYRGAA